MRITAPMTEGDNVVTGSKSVRVGYHAAGLGLQRTLCKGPKRNRGWVVVHLDSGRVLSIQRLEYHQARRVLAVAAILADNLHFSWTLTEMQLKAAILECCAPKKIRKALNAAACIARPNNAEQRRAARPTAIVAAALDEIRGI